MFEFIRVFILILGKNECPAGFLQREGFCVGE